MRRHVTYTNQRAAKGCTALSRDLPVSSVPGRHTPSRSAASSPSPSSFPKVDSDTQQRRDSDRRKLLEQELSAEEQSLEQARKQLAEQESVRMGDERNYQRVIDRVQPFKDKVALHERNIEALKRESEPALRQPASRGRRANARAGVPANLVQLVARLLASPITPYCRTRFTRNFIPLTL